jgi:ATP-dependent Clp protease ATP-binding subunit ClpB
LNNISRVINPKLRSGEAEEFDRKLRSKIIGQGEAITAVSEIYQMYLAKLNAPGRPVGTMLFLGPTGTGKTRVLEALGETLFNTPQAILKVDCAEFQHSHEIAKLLGSPPGYLGHRETNPFFTQERLAAFHTEKCKLSIVLFDEIEKASDALWNLMLGIMDKATLTLGDNRKVDFSNTIIAMTSNLGAKEMSDVLGNGFGFAPAASNVNGYLNTQLSTIAENAAKRKFSPEFMNRIDRTVVFHALTKEHIHKILDIELGAVQSRILQSPGNSQFVFRVNSDAREFLVENGYSAKNGARELKRTVELCLTHSFASLVSTQQIKLGDVVEVGLDAEAGELTFTVIAEQALAPIKVAIEKSQQQELFNPPEKSAKLPPMEKWDRREYMPPLPPWDFNKEPITKKPVVRRKPIAR